MLSNMLNAVNNFFSAFGATVVVPIMIFIIALFLKVRPKVAMMSAFYAGVGLTGFGWILTLIRPLMT
ncbi:PTS transporter subunit IIC, partial [Mordavella massiliensis]|uniref:PTS transporter subunit IIC n=1 Tax=Mordavella massiliensis TaxID=1871024 RepID=UPI0023EE3288|nr:PTS galactitol transporter subunit IIC [Mordavella massiliensis]